MEQAPVVDCGVSFDHLLHLHELRVEHVNLFYILKHLQLQLFEHFQTHFLKLFVYVVHELLDVMGCEGKEFLLDAGADSKLIHQVLKAVLHRAYVSSYLCFQGVLVPLEERLT